MEMFLPSMIIAFGVSTLIASYASAKKILPVYLIILITLTILGSLAIGEWMIFVMMLATPAFLSTLVGIAFGAIIRAARLESLDRAFAQSSVRPAN